MSWNPPKVYKEVKQVEIFVLTCIDPRYTYFLTWFLNHEKEVYVDYDLVALAGASMCVLNPTPPLGSGLPPTAPWLTTLDNHVALARALHNIKEIWLFEHEGCGAYVNYLNDDSDAKHISTMNSMVTHLKIANPTLKYKTFLMKFDGTINLISNDGGLTVFNLSSYYPQRLPWIMFIVTVSILGATWLALMMRRKY